MRDIDIADLITTTLYNEPKGRFINMAPELTKYVVMRELLTKRGGLVVKKGGVGIKETLMVDAGGRSRWVGELEEDVVTIGDHLKKMQLNWCLLTDNMAYGKSEILENRGRERINNVIKPRRMAMMLRVAASMEDAFFDAPDASDPLTPWGLQYWIVKNSSTGFNGGLPSGFTTVANINLTQVPQFKNYTGTYTTISKTDLVEKLRTAHRHTDWVSPVKMSDFYGDFGQRRVLFVNEATIMGLENVGEAQNENLGRDLAPYSGDNRGRRDMMFIDGEIVFKKHPIRYAPHLDADTTNPVYMIDLATLHALTLAGENMNESDVVSLAAGKQHRVYVSYIDHKCQWICNNRRSNVVFYQV